jgi:predicted DCC family thiol-disulfide oxidoreductase YuxK
VLARDRRREFRFAPLKGPTARAVLLRHGRSPTDLDTLWVVADVGTSKERVLSRARAVLFVLGRLSGPWRHASMLAVVPGPALDLAYDLVAATRYRVFGRLDACPVPSPQHLERFVDVEP